MKNYNEKERSCEERSLVPGLIGTLTHQGKRPRFSLQALMT